MEMALIRKNRKPLSDKIYPQHVLMFKLEYPPHAKMGFIMEMLTSSPDSMRLLLFCPASY